MKFIAPLAVVVAAVAAQETSTLTSTITTTYTSTCTVKYASAVTSAAVASRVSVPVADFASTVTVPTVAVIYPTNVYNPTQVHSGTAAPTAAYNGTGQAIPTSPPFVGGASSSAPQQALAAAVVGLTILFSIC